MRHFVAATAVALLVALLTLQSVDARRSSRVKDEPDDENSVYASVAYYGKLLLGLSPILGIGLFAFCTKDAPDEEAKRSAKKDHCST